MYKIVFGLDNVTEQSVRDAIDIGYRIFDSSDAYKEAGKDNEATQLLRDAISERSDKDTFRLIYKIDNIEACSKEKLKILAQKLNGSIYVIMPHHIIKKSDYNKIEEFKNNLPEIENIGASNINIADINEYYDKGCKFFELSADVIFDEDLYCDTYSFDKVNIYIYGLVKTAIGIMNSADYKDIAEKMNLLQVSIGDIILGVLNYLKDTFNGAEIIPILSSNKKETIQDNWNLIYKGGEVPDEKMKNINKVITDVVKNKVLNARPIKEMPKEIAEELLKMAEDGNRIELLNNYKEANKQNDKFNINYSYIINGQFLIYSINDLIDNLKSKGKETCSYVNAYTFVSYRLEMDLPD